MNELGSMQRLRECLDVVEIVIGFLSSNKSVASTELRTYIGRFLKMEKRFKSEKVATINCLPLYLKFSLLFLYNYNIGSAILRSWSCIITMGDTFSRNGKTPYSQWTSNNVFPKNIGIVNFKEPFDAFSQVLLTELQDDQKEQLNSYLRGIELTPFLNLCYEFIETTVRHSEAQNTIDWL